MENKVETATVYWLRMRAKKRDSAGKMYPSCEAVSRMLRGCFYRMVCLLFFANETNGSKPTACGSRGCRPWQQRFEFPRPV